MMTNRLTTIEGEKPMKGYRNTVMAVIALVMIIGWPKLNYGDTSVPGAQTFSCSSGFTALEIKISSHGNVNSFSSPGPILPNHINGSTSGYQVCYATGSGGPYSTAFDNGASESGWAAAVTTSQPSGPGTFPLEITRTTADGRVRITRRFTGNSFAQPCSGGACPAGFDSDGDGIACNILGDCGNCTNRTLHVLTRVTNLTGGSLFDVTVMEKADFDIAGQTTNQFGRSEDSVLAFTDSSVDAANAYGMVLQTLIMPASSAVVNAGSYGFPNDCNATTLTTPTGLGNFEGLLKQPFGTLSPGANTGNSIRTHYRRF